MDAGHFSAEKNPSHSTHKPGTITWGQAQAFTKPLNVRKTPSPVPPPPRPLKLQKLRLLKEASVLTSGQFPCFCPGVTMKLVITTNELSPCGDTANKITASTAFSDGVSARSLSLGQGVGHPNHQADGTFLPNFGSSALCRSSGSWWWPWGAAVPPAPGTVEDPPCCPRCSSGGTRGPLILLEAASNVPHQPWQVPSAECFPGVICGQRFVAGGTCFPPQAHHVMVNPMENLHRGAHLHTSTWGKAAIRTKATSLTHPPTCLLTCGGKT